MIKLLDDLTISKIAAGEIVENPASVVKELIENSIDAKSTSIDIEISADPSEYIRVSDNGNGISEDEIDTAFLRHSTSKLSTIEDLNSLHTLGFRGEALPSIASVSEVKVLTKTKDSNIGSMVEYNRDNRIKKSIGMPEGTTIVVKNLFYNTPVRKNFLKNENFESNLIYDVVQKLALSNSDISFSLIKDKKTVLNTQKTDNYKNRIFDILGREIARNLNFTSFESVDYNIDLYLSNNKLFRATRSHQYIYINGRFVRNLLISKEIEKFYKSLIPLNRYPVFILKAEINPTLIDVNIHPKKHEIKLSKDNALLNLLSDMVMQNLYPSRQISNIEIKREDEKLNIFEIFGEEDCSDFQKNQLVKDRDQHSALLNDISLEHEKNDIVFEELAVNDTEILYETDLKKYPTKEVINDDFNRESYNLNKNQEFTESSFIDDNLLNCRFVGIIFKTYIILEDFSKKTIFLIDQHAAHERILYEKFKNMYLNQTINSQILLKPELLELTAIEFNKLENNLLKFKELGFEIEEIAESNLVLRSVPIIFGMPSYNNFIRDIISSIDDLNSNYEADLYKIMRKACKKAVKAGDNLSELEVRELLTDLLNCENPYTCPHGRPTIIEFKDRDLMKLFLRE